MITVSFVSSQRQARDVNRKSDLAQYRNALENYANQNSSLYPVVSANSRIDPVNLCGSGNPLASVSKCPEDPENVQSGGNYYYSYITDTAGSEYVLYAQLENVSTKTYWVVCSNGRSGNMTGSYPTSADCPL
jgi:type II secretory pathway pseudopilin PulG